MPLEGIHLGHYRLIKQIGGGEMSEVYLAENLNLQGRQVAIKLVRAELAPYPTSASSRDSGKLFQREARAVSLLDRHPHILPLYDFGEEEVHGALVTYLVMPFAPEGSLLDWLNQHSGAGILAPVEAEYIVSQAADALQYAHSQDIIHQDVKPSNFLVQRISAANLPYIQLADFGIARLSSVTTSISQSVRGTIAYMPPEQWRGRPVPASDQYALATMTYELLSGRTPFQGDLAGLMYQHAYEKPQAPSRFNPHLSPDIDTVILHALEKEPENRFRSISAFANAFQQAVSGGSGEPIPPPPPLSSNLSGTAGGVFPAAQPALKTRPAASIPVAAASQRGLHRSRLTVAVSVALVLFLALAGAIFAVSTATQKNNAASTATTAQIAKARASATAGTLATVKAQAQATARANARANTAHPDPYPGANKIALLDLLKGGSGDSGWDSNSDCGFHTDGYHASEASSATYNACYLSGSSYDNFTMEVDMTVIRGDCGGIVFRSDSDSGKEYFFRVCQDNQRYYLYNCPGRGKNCQELNSRLNLELNINQGLKTSTTKSPLSSPAATLACISTAAAPKA